ncbi:uncharacterized protein [Nicotiana sylvestris]|uniref:uncharacterized protein n=1 Tax=Nicotiana sylvestris TaxID=4096 RepID=UPI00388C4862
MEETSTIKLTEHCSVIFQIKLPQKYGDPRSFTLPCSLRSTKFEKSLCDSGIVKDVLVRVDKFVFPVDFIVVNMEREGTHAQSRGGKGDLQDGRINGVLKEKLGESKMGKCGVYPKKA